MSLKRPRPGSRSRVDDADADDGEIAAIDTFSPLDTFAPLRLPFAEHQPSPHETRSHTTQPDVDGAELHDADFNALGERAWTLAYNGDYSGLTSLMTRHENVRINRWIHPQHGSTALHAACDSMNPGTDDCVELLAACRQRTEAAKLAHKRSVLNLGMVERDEVLEGLDTSLTPVSKGGATPLFIACYRAKESKVVALLKAGADPNKGNDDRVTPLKMCVYKDAGACLIQLLRSKSGITEPLEPALEFAEAHGRLECKDILTRAARFSASLLRAPSVLERGEQVRSPTNAPSRSSAAEVPSASLGSPPRTSTPVSSSPPRPRAPAVTSVGSPLCQTAPPSFERSSSSISWGRRIGRGTFGIVFEVECGGIKMAAKKVDYDENERDKAETAVRREFRALNKLDHECILTPLGIVVDAPDSLTLLTELMPLGSLRKVLDGTPTIITSDPATQLRLADCFVRGMEFLHGEKMLHHDLKSSNLLLKYEEEKGKPLLILKIADFGMATGTKESTFRSARNPEGAGSPHYKAPELFEEGPAGGDDTHSQPPFTEACDVYAFGICVWEIVTGGKPWAGKQLFQLVRALLRGERPELNAAQKKTFLGAWAQRCWDQDPIRRPTFRSLRREMRLAPRQCDTALQLLIFACSPTLSPVPQAGLEALQVSMASNFGEACQISWGGTLASLRNTLTRRRTRSFLFTGHADAGGRALAFTKPGGGIEVNQPEDVADVLGDFASSLKLVFLNGCSSLSLGRLVKNRKIPIVVCWKTQVEDEAACIFAKGFFAAFASGKTHQDAFRAAKQGIKLETRAGHLPGGITPADVPKYELRERGTPTASHPFLPPPIAAGVPVLICEDGEIE